MSEEREAEPGGIAPELKAIMDRANARTDTGWRSDGERAAENPDRWLNSWLVKAGFNRRELTARVELIPSWITVKLPATVDVMVKGDRPDQGFGLSGEAGAGKTFALAALMRSMARARVVSHAATNERVLDLWLGFTHWPEFSNRLRSIASRDGGFEDATERIEKLAHTPVLVLDDLGAERLKGTYVDDWITNHLEIVLDKRYGAMLPTWYTANVGDEEFIDRYGARLYSRLCAHNPMVTVAPETDLRLEGGRK